MNISYSTVQMDIIPCSCYESVDKLFSPMSDFFYKKKKNHLLFPKSKFKNLFFL